MRRPAAERDGWFDAVLGLDSVPDDGPELPRGCTPYLPAPVDAIMRAVDWANVQPSDVFVDIGSGLGRAAVLAHLLTGAATVGLEIQSDLVRRSRALLESLHLSRCTVLEGDAPKLVGSTAGSVFFFYCPFSGERLDETLTTLAAVAAERPIRVCTVDLPLPPCPWLELISPPGLDVAVYRSMAPKPR